MSILHASTEQVRELAHRAFYYYRPELNNIVDYPLIIRTTDRPINLRFIVPWSTMTSSLVAVLLRGSRYANPVLDRAKADEFIAVCRWGAVRAVRCSRHAVRRARLGFRSSARLVEEFRSYHLAGRDRGPLNSTMLGAPISGCGLARPRRCVASLAPFGEVSRAATEAVPRSICSRWRPLYRWWQ